MSNSWWSNFIPNLNGSVVVAGLYRTRATAKAYPGDQAADYELVTLAWPLLTPEDCQQLTNQPGNHARQQWFQQRLIG
ncbi:MAG: hypothetical protein U0401_19410 [Anaerolineae bacterium]